MGAFFLQNGEKNCFSDELTVSFVEPHTNVIDMLSHHV